MAAGVTRGPADEPHLENDFAVLAASFSKQDGGGLPPEFSAELALEIVLNEIVEKACLTTGATGSAIVLRRDGEMVCRASSGLTAPDLGSRLDEDSGLSGECIRTRRTQRCVDAFEDPRVDREASERLGVRSVTVMPLIRDTELVGVFELFSSQPNAFGESAEHALEALGSRVVSSLERALQPLAPHTEPSNPLPVEDVLPEGPDVPEPGEVDWVTSALGIAVLACAILLGILIGGHLRLQKKAVRSRPAQSSAVAGTPNSDRPTVHPASDNAGEAIKPIGSDVPGGQPSRKASEQKAVPEGGLLVFENGREVFRMPAGETEPQGGSGPQSGNEAAQAASRESEALPVSAADAESSLVRRVEPEYPESARRAGIQGTVVLNIHIGSDGTVESAQLVSGPRELVQASMDAVKQWRFKPHVVNGRPARMQTTLTLNFKLPPQ